MKQLLVNKALLKAQINQIITTIVSSFNTSSPSRERKKVRKLIEMASNRATSSPNSNISHASFHLLMQETLGLQDPSRPLLQKKKKKKKA